MRIFRKLLPFIFTLLMRYASGRPRAADKIVETTVTFSEFTIVPQ